MKYFVLFLGLLFVVASPLYAQEWTPQSSLHLRRSLGGKGEIRLNSDVSKEIGVDSPLGSLKEDMSKSWLGFNFSSPIMPQMPEKKVVLILCLYTANTKYNWDPVYQKEITVNKNTWRGNSFYKLTRLKVYINWAKRPLGAGPRKSAEQIEATGLRYMVTERANNMAVGNWRGVGGGGTLGDFMVPFARDFWNIKGRRRRARMLEVLKTYDNPINVRCGDAIIK